MVRTEFQVAAREYFKSSVIWHTIVTTLGLTIEPSQRAARRAAFSTMGWDWTRVDRVEIASLRPERYRVHSGSYTLTHRIFASLRTMAEHIADCPLPRASRP